MKRTDILAYRRLAKERLRGLEILRTVLIEAAHAGLIDDKQSREGARKAREEVEALRSELYGRHPRDFAIQGITFRELSDNPPRSIEEEGVRLVRAPAGIPCSDVKKTLLRHFSYGCRCHTACNCWNGFAYSVKRLKRREWRISIHHYQKGGNHGL